jgi:hypothetical protein
MQKLLASTVIAVTLASASAFAQAPAKAPTAPAAPAVTLDQAGETKFKAVDKDNSGVLEATETTAYKADMAKIDTDKDGKVSKAEFASALKNGIIK